MKIPLFSKVSGSIGIMLVLAGLVAAAVVPGEPVVDQPWGTQCSLDWCAETPPPAYDGFDDLQVAADVAEAGQGHDCVPLEQWPKDQIPATMTVVVGGTVDNRTWTYPVEPEVEVKELCVA